MVNQNNAKDTQMDRATSTSICRAIGERLRQNLTPEPVGLPDRLQHLMEALRMQDGQGRS
jgi:hypothetical protein